MKLPSILEFTLLNSVSASEKLAFTKHLSIMLKSGLPISESLSIIAKQTTNPHFRKIVIKIQREVANGQQLHKALSLFPHVFNTFYLQLVRIGEESGMLEKNLEYLAVHLKKEHDFSNKISGALLYPTIVLIIALLSGMGLSLFVLPKMIDLFNSLDIDLPITTKILLFFAKVMRDYGVFIFITFISCIVFFKIIISQNFAKPVWHKLLLSLPVLGVFLQNIELASMCRNIGVMLASGMPIVLALQTQQQTTTNIIYSSYLLKLQNGVEKGKTLESLFDSEKFSLFPLIATKMLSVGEKTGKLDESFNYMGDYFEDEVDTLSKNISTVLEPIILIFVGLVVAFIALSIIGPIYQFTGSIKR